MGWGGCGEDGGDVGDWATGYEFFCEFVLCDKVVPL